MNQNRPFFSTNTNLYDESFRSSAPTTLNGENVILSQEQQRRVCDTLNTSIVGNPFGFPGNQQQMLFAQKQFFPGGVLFTFPQSPYLAPQNIISQGGCCKCSSNSIPNTIPVQFDHFHRPPAAVNTFFPSSMEYQQLKGCGGLNYQQPQAKEPFQLKFHHDHSTSCSDLLNHFTQVPASKGLPDLCNINGILQTMQNQNDPKMCQATQQLLFPSPPIEFSSNAKKLILSKPVPPPCGHAVDILDDEMKNENNKKKVSFSDPNNPATGDKSCQITNDCICDVKKCKSKSKTNKKKQKSSDDECSTDKPKKQKEKKKKEKTQSNTSSETTLSSDGEDSQKPKKKQWLCHQQKTEFDSSDDMQLSDSEDDKSDSEKRKRRKNRKKKIKNNQENICGNDSQMDTSKGADSGSEQSQGK